MVRLIMNKAEMEMRELNKFIHKNSDKLDYHIKHLELVKGYMLRLCDKLGFKVTEDKISYIAYGHDLLKERGLDTNSIVNYNGIDIPQDLIRYVRTNLDTLETYGLDEYFNSDMQYHAVASGIFMIKELGITDPEIIYPVMFHSCPVMEVYWKLPLRVRTLVDITMLADKLSSNCLRINMLEREVCMDLDFAVFGPTGKEFNYSMGLYLARLINQKKSNGACSVAATLDYHSRLVAMNPILRETAEIGGKGLWPKRNQPLKIQ